MSNDPEQETDPNQPMIYQIRIECHVDDQWADCFGGMTIILEENGDTVLTGPVVDQAALFGLLKKVRDLGMPLISVDRVEHVKLDFRRAQPKATIVEQEEIKMNTIGNLTKRLDTKVLFSTLWIVVMINILTADILSLNIPGSEELLKTTSVSAGLSIPQLMLVGAIMNELSLVMIILSRALKYGVNRWINIIVAVISIAYIWAGAAPYPHYTFIATVETLCLLLIVWKAWKWSSSEE